jgi:hypothetical protein
VRIRIGALRQDQRPRPSAAAPKARLNQKIARQSQIPVSTPPMAGPRASASPQTAV